MFNVVIGGCQVEYDAFCFETLSGLKKWRVKNPADILGGAMLDAPDDDGK